MKTRIETRELFFMADSVNPHSCTSMKTRIETLISETSLKHI
ncbi:Uncharacterized protein dnl_30470 [Desulfonema limicola]|uniref:Uncharacterized protein n=1 Tax=Desulfonema limicola TaxID=45656 RepID=A0A975B849_9BACT|nr:Uncharacterized protein dnl_30470 [Desulfonema limicola]